MAVEQTSMLAYRTLQRTLGERQARVLGVIGSYARLNNREIAEYSGLPINCVTPRVLELRRLGLVEPSIIVTDTVTHRKTITWRVV